MTLQSFATCILHVFCAYICITLLTQAQIARIAAIVAATLGVANAVKPVEVRQQEFVVAETGKRFMLLGVDYQPGGQAGYKPQDGTDALT